MTRATRWLGVAAVLAALGAPLSAAPQEAAFAIDVYDRPSVRILQDYTLRADDTARQVVVIAGDAKIEGHVTQDVIVVLGKLQLASTAVIDGSLVAVAGTVDVAEGAKVNRDFVSVGEAHVPPSFSPGGEHVAIGMAGLGEGLRAMVPWLTGGLLLGRPIVPTLGWVWIVAGLFFLLNLCLNLMFDGPVRAATTTLRTSPFSAFMAGLLVMLLIGPVCLLLAVSVIGIVVIPFVLCALLAAAVLGRVAFARWMGMSLVHQEDAADRAQSTRSFLIGSVVMGITYMVPFLGFMVWILAGVFGLGAATLAFYASYRRENPRTPKVRPPAPPVPPVAPPPPVETLESSSVQVEEGVPMEPAAAVSVDRPTSPLIAYPKADFMPRLAALALDTILIFIVAQALDFDRYGGTSERLVLMLALAYHVGFWTLRSTTLGGIICQLRVVRTDGQKLDFPESLVRGLTGIFSLAVAGIGFLWILRDPERQAWHDRVAGTYVVRVPRAYPI
jgi:uncharacterized RDD family membrane protein YckC